MISPREKQLVLLVGISRATHDQPVPLPIHLYRRLGDLDDTRVRVPDRRESVFVDAGDRVENVLVERARDREACAVIAANVDYVLGEEP